MGDGRKETQNQAQPTLLFIGRLCVCSDHTLRRAFRRSSPPLSPISYGAGTISRTPSPVPASPSRPALRSMAA